MLLELLDQPEERKGLGSFQPTRWDEARQAAGRRSLALPGYVRVPSQDAGGAEGRGAGGVAARAHMWSDGKGARGLCLLFNGGNASPA